MHLYREFQLKPELPAEEFNNTYLPFVMLDNFFSEAEVKRILELWDEEGAKTGKVGENSDINTNVRKAREIFINAENNEWIYDKIGKTAIMLNTMRFKFSIAGFESRIRMIEYQEGDFFEWHMDYGPGKSSNRKIIVCVQLSSESEYTGGELQLLHDRISTPKTIGSAAVFAGYLPHRVTAVTAGKRKSMVAIISGPPFK